MHSLEMLCYFSILLITSSELVQCENRVNNDILLPEKKEELDFLSLNLESPWEALLPKTNEDHNHSVKRTPSSTYGVNKIPGNGDKTNIYSSISGGRRRHTRQTYPGYSSSNLYFNTHVPSVKPSYGGYNNSSFHKTVNGPRNPQYPNLPSQNKTFSSYNQQWNYISTSTYPTYNPVSFRPIYQSSSDNNRFLYNSNHPGSNSASQNNFISNNNYHSGYKVNNTNVKPQFNNNSFYGTTYPLFKASNSTITRTIYNTRNGTGTIANNPSYNSNNLNSQVTYPSYGINNSHNSFGQESKGLANHSYWNQYPNVNLNRNSFSQQSEFKADRKNPNYNPVGDLILNGNYPSTQNINSRYRPYGVNKTQGNFNANQGYPNYNPVGDLILNGNYPSTQNNNYNSTYPYGVNKTHSVGQGGLNVNQGYPYPYSNYVKQPTTQYGNFNNNPLDPSKHVANNPTFPTTYPGYEPNHFYYNPTTNRPIYDPRKNPPQKFSY